MKYDLYRLFFDADSISCIFLEDVVKAFPNLKEQFEKKTWDIENNIVLAVSDAQDIINAYIDGVELG